MTPDAAAGAADILARARLDGALVAPLPAACRPATITEGYAIQHLLHARLAAAGRGGFGVQKIGCTTPVMQDYMGIDHPCAGAIRETGVHRDAADLRHGDFRRVGVECEIAVRLSADLGREGAPFTRDGVAAAVGACMVAIEIVDDRYTDFTTLGTPTLIADDFFAAGCVLGAPVEDWRALDLAAARGTMTVNGADAGTGTGAAVMGHPLEALAWLARARHQEGRPLAAGDTVLTGSIVKTRWLDAGSTVVVAVEGLGEVSLVVS